MNCVLLGFSSSLWWWSYAYHQTRTGNAKSLARHNVIFYIFSSSIYEKNATCAVRWSLLFFQHGSTYGGNPLGCKVAVTALKVRYEIKILWIKFNLWIMNIIDNYSECLVSMSSCLAFFSIQELFGKCSMFFGREKMRWTFFSFRTIHCGSV